jgi:hypothetical protein
MAQRIADNHRGAMGASRSKVRPQLASIPDQIGA